MIMEYWLAVLMFIRYYEWKKSQSNIGIEDQIQCKSR